MKLIATLIAACAALTVAAPATAQTKLKWAHAVSYTHLTLPTKRIV